MVFGVTRPWGELTTYRARGGQATDWANPTPKLLLALLPINAGHSRKYHLALYFLIALQTLDENICLFWLKFYLSRAPGLVIFLPLGGVEKVKKSNKDDDDNNNGHRVITRVTLTHSLIGTSCNLDHFEEVFKLHFLNNIEKLTVANIVVNIFSRNYCMSMISILHFSKFYCLPVHYNQESGQLTEKASSKPWSFKLLESNMPTMPSIPRHFHSSAHFLVSNKNCFHHKHF